jgi:hypothetical protein
VVGTFDLRGIQLIHIQYTSYCKSSRGNVTIPPFLLKTKVDAVLRLFSVLETEKIYNLVKVNVQLQGQLYLHKISAQLYLMPTKGTRTVAEVLDQELDPEPGVESLIFVTKLHGHRGEG